MRSPLQASLILVIGLFVSAYADPPALPAGLDGLGSNEKPKDTEASIPPALPEGLGDLNALSQSNQESEPRKSSSLRFSGFAEVRSGVRLHNNPYSDDAMLNEFRMQTQVSGNANPFRYRLTLDWVADAEADSSAIDLRNGQGWLDPREVWVSSQPFDFLDVKAGRQIVTWGTGDLLFINDLFPKDW